MQVEKLFAQAAEHYGVQTVVLRAGDFYGGTQAGSWFDLALVNRLEHDQFVYPGPLNVLHSWAYLPDFARCLVALPGSASSCRCMGSTCFSGHTLTGAELRVLVEQACGRQVTRLSFPSKLIRLGRWLVPLWRELAEVAYLWEWPQQLNGQALQVLLGADNRAHTDPAGSVRLLAGSGQNC
ncbi:MAG: hypothetical protein R3E95_22185 [Thiolinea sp.]